MCVLCIEHNKKLTKKANSRYDTPRHYLSILAMFISIKITKHVQLKYFIIILFIYPLHISLYNIFSISREINDKKIRFHEYSTCFEIILFVRNKQFFHLLFGITSISDIIMFRNVAFMGNRPPTCMIIARK